MIETDPLHATFVMIIDTDLAGQNHDSGVVAEYKRLTDGSAERTYLREGYGATAPKL